MSGHIRTLRLGVGSRRSSWWSFARALLPLPDGKSAYLAYLAFVVFTFLIISYYTMGAELAAAAATVAVLVNVLQGRVRLNITPEVVALSAVLLIAWLSGRDALDADAASIRLSELGKIVLIYFVAIQVLTTEKRTVRFAAVWLGAFLLFPARGTIVNYLAGYDVFGRALWNYVYANPNDLAALTLIAVAVGGALFSVLHWRIARVGILVGLAILVTVIILTGSRGALLGTLAGTAVYVWLNRRNVKIIAVMVCCFVVGYVLAPDVFRDRVSTLRSITAPSEIREHDAGSAMERWNIWKTTFQIIDDHALFGVGIGSFPVANVRYATSRRSYYEPFARAAAARQSAHNTFLELWAEIGSIGLFAYCVFLGLTWYRIRSVYKRWRRRRPELVRSLVPIEAGLVGIIVASLFATYTFLTLPYVYLALVSVWASHVDRIGKARPDFPGSARPGMPRRVRVRAQPRLCSRESA